VSNRAAAITAAFLDVRLLTKDDTSREASLEDRQQNFDLTADKSKLMAKLHPCTETDGR
jgi:hypothetical protein